MDVEKLKDILTKGENTDSDGNFYDGNLYTRKAEGSSAVGKYQFVQSVWGDRIKEFATTNGYKYAGINDFINNAILQEEFTEDYISKDLIPQVNSLKSNYDVKGISDEQMAAMLHYSGYGNLKKAILNKDFDSKINAISPNEYLKRSGLSIIEDRPANEDRVTPKERRESFELIQEPPSYIAEVDNTYVKPQTVIQSETAKRIPLSLISELLETPDAEGSTLYSKGGKVKLCLK